MNITAAMSDQSLSIIRSPRALQRKVLSWKRRGIRICLVTTMGYLHAGHESLIKKARRIAGSNGKVIVSIFVNPTQFAPSEDLTRYPRNFKHDRQICKASGADIIFAPSASAMYPGRELGRYSTYVNEEQLSRTMEGQVRPSHFRGVTTVVAKLFNCALPDTAVFGAKDWQQAAIIRRMVSDLNFPVKIVVAPTVRERSGLALSSRNVYLTSKERDCAVVLHKSIQLARRLVRENETSRAKIEREVRVLVSKTPHAKLDYVNFFNSATLEPLSKVARGSHMALAVYVGKTRLIDNAKL